MRTERGFGVLAAAPGMTRDPAPGACVGGKYELCRKIGEGAMGQVWAAKHVSLKEDVAIKLVLREAAHDDGSRVDRRFLVEARLASQLSRKTRHVVSVTDHGHDGLYAYLVMELLDGESLDARLHRTGPMPLGKVVALVHQVARALTLAHADGIVHRDLKPSNVFVTLDEDGRALIKLLDFGIAKQRRIASETSKIQTIPGSLIGTPAYMSPEQARGEPIDHRADVWALAVIAYELLTGAFPFDGDTALELFSRICNVEAIPITEFRSDLDAVADVFARAFSESVAERFASATDFACALERASSARGWSGAFPAISAPPPRGALGPLEDVPHVRVAPRSPVGGERSRAPSAPAPEAPPTSTLLLPPFIPSPPMSPNLGTLRLVPARPSTTPPPAPGPGTLRLASAITLPEPLDDLVIAGLPQRPRRTRSLAYVAITVALITLVAVHFGGGTTGRRSEPRDFEGSSVDPPPPSVVEVVPPPPTAAASSAPTTEHPRVARASTPNPKPRAAVPSATVAPPPPGASATTAPARRGDPSDVF